MCLKPRLIPNPWYFPPDKRSKMERLLPSWFLHDTTNAFMKIPCGNCSECLQARQNEFVQRIIEMSKFNYLLYGTLTYNPQSLPYFYANGYRINYAEKRDFQLFIRRLKASNILPEFRYFAVSEYGSDETKSHRPHFHFLIFIPIEEERSKRNPYLGYDYAKIVLDFITSPNGWQRNYGDKLDPLFLPLSAFINRGNKYTYDCHFVDGSPEDVGYYVSKYILKFSDYVSRTQSALRLNLSSEDYYKCWSKFRPKILLSKGLGIKFFKNSGFADSDIDEEIFMDISGMLDYSSKNESYPQFYFGSEKFPLSQYFKKRIMTENQAIAFHNNRFEDGPFHDESMEYEVFADNFQFDVDKIVDKEEKFINLCKRLDQNKY